MDKAKSSKEKPNKDKKELIMDLLAKNNLQEALHHLREYKEKQKEKEDLEKLEQMFDLMMITIQKKKEVEGSNKQQKHKGPQRGEGRCGAGQGSYKNQGNRVAGDHHKDAAQQYKNKGQSKQQKAGQQNDYKGGPNRGGRGGQYTRGGRGEHHNRGAHQAHQPSVFYQSRPPYQGEPPPPPPAYPHPYPAGPGPLMPPQHFNPVSHPYYGPPPPQFYPNYNYMPPPPPFPVPGPSMQHTPHGPSTSIEVKVNLNENKHERRSTEGAVAGENENKCMEPPPAYETVVPRGAQNAGNSASNVARGKCAQRETGAYRGARGQQYFKKTPVRKQPPETNKNKGIDGNESDSSEESIEVVDSKQAGIVDVSLERTMETLRKKIASFLKK